MNITLYSTSSERNRVVKDLGNSLTITGNLKQGLSIINPTIIIAYNNSVYNYNYVYIPEFRRYYFIENINIINNTLELSLHEDVLMSNSADILRSKATITRGSSGSKYLNDVRIKNTAQHTLTHRRIGTGFTAQDEYIVVIAGRSVE